MPSELRLETFSGPLTLNFTKETPVQVRALISIHDVNLRNIYSKFTESYVEENKNQGKFAVWLLDDVLDSTALFCHLEGLTFVKINVTYIYGVFTFRTKSHLSLT